VSRAWLFENTSGDGGVRARQRAEWCAPGVRAQLANEDLQAASYPSRWAPELEAGRAVSVDVASAEPDERALLAPQDIHSLVTVPIRVGRRWWGTIGFDECRAPRGWSSPEVAALRAAAAIIGAAVDGGEAARALEASETRFRTAFDEAAVGMAIVAQDGRFTRVNEALCELVGYSRDELTQMSVRDLTHPDDRDANRVNVRRLLAGEASTFRMEKRYVRKDGRAVWILVNVSLVRDDDGAPRYFVAEMQDISERKHHEDELRESEERFRAAADSAPVMIWMSEADGSPAFFNRGWLEFTGHTMEQALDIPWLGVHPDDVPDGERIYRVALTSRTGYEAEYRMLRADGEYRWVVDRAAPRLLADGTFGGLTGIVVDITERKLVEAEHERMLAYEREQVERLRELDRMKDDFVATVSHELRTPLTNILGYLSLVLEGDLDTADREALDVVDRNARRLLTLVGDLLVVAQLDAGRLVLEREVVDLERLVRECAASAAPMAATHEVAVHVEAPQALELAGDPVRLAQLLDNLVSNAVKFTARGGRVELRAYERAGCAVIEVADTGIGIAEADRGRLFERFYRTEQARRQAIQGTGLGLTIVKAITEAHGGSIDVESEVGRGTTFRVELPLRLGAAVAA
jgi:PAS domain S-box-containing protein